MIAAIALVLGQIVNVQPLMGTEDEQGLRGSLDGSIDWRSGNTRLVLASATGTLRYRTGGHTFFATARAEVGRRGAEELVRKHFEHLRWRVGLAGPLEAEVFAQYSEDVLRRVAVRGLFGAGPRLRFVTLPIFDAAVGALPMLELEQLGSGAYADAGDRRVRARLSAYVTLAARPAERLRVLQTIYVQPRVDAPEDHRILHELEVQALVTRALTLKWTLAQMFDSRPPVSVVPLDTTLKGAVQVNF